jgi:hypothetical protein
MGRSVKAALIFGAVCVGVTAGAQAQTQMAGRSLPARHSMEQCVGKVLASFAKLKAPEHQVGPAVLSRCDGQLRATLAEAIRTGEAAICGTVDGCIQMARERASSEATMMYRQHMMR